MTQNSYYEYYMKNFKNFYDKNILKKRLNNMRVLGIHSYKHYLEQFLTMYYNEDIKDDIDDIRKEIIKMEDKWIEIAFDDIFSSFGETKLQSDKIVSKKLENSVKPISAQMSAQTPIPIPISTQISAQISQLDLSEEIMLVINKYKK